MEPAEGFQEKLQGLLDRLSAYLTEVEIGSPVRRAYFPAVKYNDWVLGGSEHYLADGGYSRVVNSYDNHVTFLTSNSTDNVKDRWDNPEAVNLRSEIDALVRDQWILWQEETFE